jgi:hypothetical protein
MLVKALTLGNRVNLVGIASSIPLLYVALSNNPWWVAYGGRDGEHTFSAEVSPFNIAVQVLGKPVTVPILPYLNLAARLSILLAAVTIFAGSLLARKPWSKPLMSLRGLTLPILFLAGLFIGLNAVKQLAGVSLPLAGKSTLKYSIPYAGGRISTETLVEATLTQEYWIALAAGVLSALAKAVQNRVAGWPTPEDAAIR